MTQNCQVRSLESVLHGGLRQREQRRDCRRNPGRPGGIVMPHRNATFTVDFGSWQHNTPRADPLWRSWCKSPIWKSIRRHRLADEPLCRQCAIEGRTVVASHVDHVDPHRGQWLQFFKYENTQSLCPHHHNRHKQHGKRASDYEKLVATHFRDSRARS